MSIFFKQKMFQPFTIGNYKLTQFIGSGSFATVWLGEHKITNQKVAVKVICKSNLNSGQNLSRFKREIDLLKQIDHPFIVQLFDVIEDDEAFYLIMEYVEKGSLFSRINSEGRLNEDVARRYFCQILSALNYLHNEKFIVHRDLKPENILIDKYDNIRIIDFGLSNQFSCADPNLNTSCGSPAYAAPEMIQGQPYTKSADIWSAGIILYAMVAGKLPFDDPDIQVLLQKVVYTEQIYPSIMSRSLIDLLKRILTKNPANRLTINQIANHLWISQSEYSSIIENNFYLLYGNAPLISSSLSMPLLSVAKSSIKSQCNSSREIQNSSSFDCLSIDSVESFDSFEKQEISQSQNAIQVPNRLVDQVVCRHMISIGINVSSLEQYLIDNEFNDTTAIYKQFKKEKISYEVNFIMCTLSESNMQFHPPKTNVFKVQKPIMFRRSSYPNQKSNQSGVIRFRKKNAKLNKDLMNPEIFPDEKNQHLSMIIQG